MVPDEYINRNKNNDLLTQISTFLLRHARTKKIKNCIEFGANIGMNIKALKIIFPKIDYYAVEINKTAAEHLSNEIPKKNIYQESMLDFKKPETWDLVLIKGVLIHINPDQIMKAYQRLFESTKKYLLICEYYSRNPEALVYRGHKNKLFKRDYAGRCLNFIKT